MKTFFNPGNLPLSSFKAMFQHSNVFTVSLLYYSACRLIGSRIIESAAYCYQILVPVYLSSEQSTSINWIIRLLSSLLCLPKVILLSGGHCMFSFLAETEEKTGDQVQLGEWCSLRATDRCSGLKIFCSLFILHENKIDQDLFWVI